VGGQSIQHQAQVLRKGIHILVGTPGRINDCIEMAYLVLNQCCYIVLDEADRMIDMGFLPQVECTIKSEVKRKHTGKKCKICSRAVKARWPGIA
jgi:ATP-dependent RNA helicase DDX23/PRP28